MIKNYLFYTNAKTLDKQAFLSTNTIADFSIFHNFSFSINGAYAIYDNKLLAWIPQTQNLYDDNLEFLSFPPISFTNFGSKKIAKICCNSEVVHATTGDYLVLSWGIDTKHQGILALGEVFEVKTPTLNNDLSSLCIMDMSLSEKHGAVIDSCRNLYTWGNGASGQLGDKTIKMSLTPRKVVLNEPFNIVKVECGKDCTCGITLKKQAFYFGRIDSSISAIISTEDQKKDITFIPLQSKIEAENIFCGEKFLAITSSTGGLFIYIENQSLLRVKIPHKITQVKFISDTFYAITPSNEILYEFINYSQKTFSFDINDYVENSYKINKRCKLKMLQSPFYVKVLFFILSCSIDEKEKYFNSESKVFIKNNHLKHNEEVSNNQTLSCIDTKIINDSNSIYSFHQTNQSRVNKISTMLGNIFERKIETIANNNKSIYYNKEESNRLFLYGKKRIELLEVDTELLDNISVLSEPSQVVNDDEKRNNIKNECLMRDLRTKPNDQSDSIKIDNIGSRKTIGKKYFDSLSIDYERKYNNTYRYNDDNRNNELIRTFGSRNKFIGLVPNSNRVKSQYHERAKYKNRNNYMRDQQGQIYDALNDYDDNSLSKYKRESYSSWKRDIDKGKIENNLLDVFDDKVQEINNDNKIKAREDLDDNNKLEKGYYNQYNMGGKMQDDLNDKIENMIQKQKRSNHNLISLPENTNTEGITNKEINRNNKEDVEKNIKEQEKIISTSDCKENINLVNSLGITQKKDNNSAKNNKKKELIMNEPVEAQKINKVILKDNKNKIAIINDSSNTQIITKNKSNNFETNNQRNNEENGMKIRDNEVEDNNNQNEEEQYTQMNNQIKNKEKNNTMMILQGNNDKMKEKAELKKASFCNCNRKKVEQTKIISNKQEQQEDNLTQQFPQEGERKSKNDIETVTPCQSDTNNNTFTLKTLSKNKKREKKIKCSNVNIDRLTNMKQIPKNEIKNMIDMNIDDKHSQKEDKLDKIKEPNLSMIPLNKYRKEIFTNKGIKEKSNEEVIGEINSLIATLSLTKQMKKETTQTINVKLLVNQSSTINNNSKLCAKTKDNSQNEHIDSNIVNDINTNNDTDTIISRNKIENGMGINKDYDLQSNINNNNLIINHHLINTNQTEEWECNIIKPVKVNKENINDYDKHSSDNQINNRIVNIDKALNNKLDECNNVILNNQDKKSNQYVQEDSELSNNNSNNQYNNFHRKNKGDSSITDKAFIENTLISNNNITESNARIVSRKSGELNKNDIVTKAADITEVNDKLFRINNNDIKESIKDNNITIDYNVNSLKTNKGEENLEDVLINNSILNPIIINALILDNEFKKTSNKAITQQKDIEKIKEINPVKDKDKFEDIKKPFNEEYDLQNYENKKSKEVVNITKENDEKGQKTLSISNDEQKINEVDTLIQDDDIKQVIETNINDKLQSNKLKVNNENIDVVKDIQNKPNQSKNFNTNENQIDEFTHTQSTFAQLIHNNNSMDKANTISINNKQYLNETINRSNDLNSTNSINQIHKQNPNYSLNNNEYIQDFTNNNMNTIAFKSINQNTLEEIKESLNQSQTINQEHQRETTKEHYLSNSKDSSQENNAIFSQLVNDNTQEKLNIDDDLVMDQNTNKIKIEVEIKENNSNTKSIPRHKNINEENNDNYQFELNTHKKQFVNKEEGKEKKIHDQQKFNSDIQSNIIRDNAITSIDNKKQNQLFDKKNLQEQQSNELDDDQHITNGKQINQFMQIQNKLALLRKETNRNTNTNNVSNLPPQFDKNKQKDNLFKEDQFQKGKVLFENRTTTKIEDIKDNEKMIQKSDKDNNEYEDFTLNNSINSLNKYNNQYYSKQVLDQHNGKNCIEEAKYLHEANNKRRQNFKDNQHLNVFEKHTKSDDNVTTKTINNKKNQDTLYNQNKTIEIIKSYSIDKEENQATNNINAQNQLFSKTKANNRIFLNENNENQSEYAKTNLELKDKNTNRQYSFETKIPIIKDLTDEFYCQTLSLSNTKINEGSISPIFFKQKPNNKSNNEKHFSQQFISNETKELLDYNIEVKDANDNIINKSTDSDHINELIDEIKETNPNIKVYTTTPLQIQKEGEHLTKENKLKHQINPIDNSKTVTNIIKRNANESNDNQSSHAKTMKIDWYKNKTKGETTIKPMKMYSNEIKEESSSLAYIIQTEPNIMRNQIYDNICQTERGIVIQKEKETEQKKKLTHKNTQPDTTNRIKSISITSDVYKYKSQNKDKENSIDEDKNIDDKDIISHKKDSVNKAHTNMNTIQSIQNQKYKPSYYTIKNNNRQMSSREMKYIKSKAMMPHKAKTQNVSLNKTTGKSNNSINNTSNNCNQDTIQQKESKGKCGSQKNVLYRHNQINDNQRIEMSIQNEGKNKTTFQQYQAITNIHSNINQLESKPNSIRNIQANSYITQSQGEDQYQNDLNNERKSNEISNYNSNIKNTKVSKPHEAISTNHNNYQLNNDSLIPDEKKVITISNRNSIIANETESESGLKKQKTQSKMNNNINKSKENDYLETVNENEQSIEKMITSTGKMKHIQKSDDISNKKIELEPKELDSVSISKDINIINLEKNKSSQPFDNRIINNAKGSNDKHEPSGKNSGTNINNENGRYDTSNRASNDTYRIDTNKTQELSSVINRNDDIKDFNNKIKIMINNANKPIVVKLKSKEELLSILQNEDFQQEESVYYLIEGDDHLADIQEDEEYQLDSPNTNQKPNSQIVKVKNKQVISIAKGKNINEFNLEYEAISKTISLNRNKKPTNNNQLNHSGEEFISNKNVVSNQALEENKVIGKEEQHEFPKHKSSHLFKVYNKKSIISGIKNNFAPLQELNQTQYKKKKKGFNLIDPSFTSTVSPNNNEDPNSTNGEVLKHFKSQSILKKSKTGVSSASTTHRNKKTNVIEKMKRQQSIAIEDKSNNNMSTAQNVYKTMSNFQNYPNILDQPLSSNVTQPQVRSAKPKTTQNSNSNNQPVPLTKTKPYSIKSNANTNINTNTNANNNNILISPKHNNLIKTAQKFFNNSNQKTATKSNQLNYINSSNYQTPSFSQSNKQIKYMKQEPNSILQLKEKNKEQQRILEHKLSLAKEEEDKALTILIQKYQDFLQKVYGKSNLMNQDTSDEAFLRDLAQNQVPIEENNLDSIQCSTNMREFIIHSLGIFKLKQVKEKLEMMKEKAENNNNIELAKSNLLGLIALDDEDELKDKSNMLEPMELDKSWISMNFRKSFVDSLKNSSNDNINQDIGFRTVKAVNIQLFKNDKK